MSSERWKDLDNFRFIALLGGKQMQKKKKVIPIVVVLFVVLFALGWLYWYYLFPNRFLGEEGDAKYYSNYMAAKLTGREISNNILDNFVFITVNGKQYRSDLTNAEKASYGLLKDDGGNYVFYRKDIGKKMGVVEESNYSLLKGLKVYYKANTNEDICILRLEEGYGYQFFKAIP